MGSFYDEIKNIFNSKEYAVKYAKLACFLFLVACCYNLFILPIHLVAGGSSGIGVLFHALFGIDSSVTLFFLSLIMFILAYLFLDAEQIVCSLFIVFIYPLFIKATSQIGGIFLIDTSDVLLIVLFSAIINGFCQGHIFKLGFNVGGFSVIALIIHKYFKKSITLVNTFINAIIVIIGIFALGMEMMLYALLFLIINRVISERVILGVSKNKTFKIISRYPDKIEKFIYNNLGHDVTIYDTYGAFTDSDRKLIMTVIPTSEFTILSDYVKSVDKKSFIFVTDTYEAKGQDLTIKRDSVK